MPRLMKTGANNVNAPNGVTYPTSGTQFVLTDAQYATVTQRDLIAALVDMGDFRAQRQNMVKADVTANLAALTTQIALSVAIPVQAGEQVNALTFVSGATAAGTPTNWWFALYDPSGNLKGQTADQTSTAWAANTAMRKALATPVVATVSGMWYASIMVKATTPPTLLGSLLISPATASINGSPILAQTHGAALVATAPATIATPTTVLTLPLVLWD